MACANCQKEYQGTPGPTNYPNFCSFCQAGTDAILAKCEAINPGYHAGQRALNESAKLICPFCNQFIK